MQKKLLMTYIVLITFVSLATAYISLQTSREYYINKLNEDVITQGTLLMNILAKEIKQGEEFSFQGFAEEYSDVIGARLTIVDHQGVVLADSESDFHDMENHADRPEIKKAAKGIIGSTTRYSETVKTYFLYTALPVNFDSFTGAVRLAIPLTKIEQMNNQIINYSMTGILFGVIVALIIAVVFSKKFATPINDLTVAARQISEGNYNKKIYVRSNDQIGQLTAAFNQMTQRLKHTISELKDRNIKLESILSSMINGIIAVDQNYNIILINPVCYQLFSIEESDVHGRPVYEIIRNQYIFSILEKSIEDEEYVVGEINYKGKKEIILRVYANPIVSQLSQGKAIGTLLVIQDITQIRKLEQMRSDFVSNVSHELKTPLTSIRGFIDTLKNGAIGDPKVANRFLEIIDLEADRLYRLIQDILSLSEIETREKDDKMEYYSIPSIINEIITMLQPKIEEKGIPITLEAEKNLPKYCCNKDRMKQMLINLLDNAIKYTEKGTVHIYCRKESTDLIITVEDTGIGIPEEHIPRLFERFYRVDKGRSRKVGGTGLGLSIVKHIVALYKGEIHVKSKIGQGSTFVIKFPLETKNI